MEGGEGQGGGEGSDSGWSSGDESAENWVQCDACNKWRSIPQAVADALDDETPWRCEDNPNREYASCSVPQEKSDKEIDREKSDSDSDAEEDGRRKRPSIWQLVDSNIYTHRKRKVQHEDDIMICQCSPSPEGGCGGDCINRMLNLECVPGYCPCGEVCQNQMFSKRKYAKVDRQRAGPKGFGLFALEDIREGQFVVEYIGEVLEEEEYERRKRYYAATGQRHYYFMNVGNGEVIDACRMGNLGRFINHSCDPNCETQKWVVQGELAIGLFATKDIMAGEELTFDYNFDRYGDRPMRCYCGTARCRGFIGGTDEGYTNGTTEVQDELSDDMEPIMVTREENDPAMQAILDMGVGLAGHHGCKAVEMRKKMQKLFVAHGLEDNLGGDSSDDDLSWIDRNFNLALHPDDTAPPPRQKSAKGKLGALHSGSPHKRGKQKKRATSPDDIESKPPGTAQKLQRRQSAKTKVGGKFQILHGRRRHREGGQGAAPSSPGRASGKKTGVFQPRRSEVDRKLEQLLGPVSSQKLNPDKDEIVKVLRLFNLCNFVPNRQEQERNRSNSHAGDGADPDNDRVSSNHYAQCSEDSDTPLTSRQWARMADLILLLNLVLKSVQPRVKKMVVECGILSQLQGLIGRNTGRQYSVILRKILKVVESLPLTSDDFHATRSGVGTFADLLNTLSLNTDTEVRTRATHILKKFRMGPPPGSFRSHTNSSSATGYSNSSSGHANPGPGYFHPGRRRPPGGTPPWAAPSPSPLRLDDRPDRFDPARRGRYGFGDSVQGQDAGVLRSSQFLESGHGPGGPGSGHGPGGPGSGHGPGGPGSLSSLPGGWRASRADTGPPVAGHGAQMPMRRPSPAGGGLPIGEHGRIGGIEVGRGRGRFSANGEDRRWRRAPGGEARAEEAGIQPVQTWATGRSASMQQPRLPPGIGAGDRQRGSPALQPQSLSAFGANRELSCEGDRGSEEGWRRDGGLGAPDSFPPGTKRQRVSPPGIPYHAQQGPSAQMGTVPPLPDDAPPPLPEGTPPQSPSPPSPPLDPNSVHCGGDVVSTENRADVAPTQFVELDVETLFANGVYGILQFMGGKEDTDGPHGHQGPISALDAPQPPPAPSWGSSKAPHLNDPTLPSPGDELRSPAPLWGDSPQLGPDGPGEGEWGRRPPSSDGVTPPEGLSPDPFGTLLLGTASGEQDVLERDVAVAGPDHWDEPNGDFEAFVSCTLKHKLAKYVQPDHPRSISREEANRLYRRLRDEVIGAERAAFREHGQRHGRRTIERTKMESNIKEYVKQRVYRLHGASSRV
ncbi:unnamed protein product [Ostreobium quekettii]|uniref:Uncharacterized protein n=1 Tax=Ostreobium quekettii TaxID=121088 RepID=A0A8S1J1X7_9CHLO|nr:unnamed protein product [Ostreobium quekettii]|eukprot:evm.model.scf_140.6 EVM.evm.TU.scf_140.6   scf_140:108838-128550(+)